MPQIIAASYGLRVADGYSIRKNLYDLGFSWLPTAREWAWRVPKNDPISGLDMAIQLCGLGAVFADDSLTKGLEQVVTVYAQTKALLGPEEARKVFLQLWFHVIVSPVSKQEKQDVR